MQPLTSAPLILRAGGVVARVRPWAFEANVAHLVLYNQSQLPTPSDITEWISGLRTAGYDTIRTGAVGAQAGARFERLGFESIQSLVLLEHKTSVRSTAASHKSAGGVDPSRHSTTTTTRAESTWRRSVPAGASIVSESAMSARRHLVTEHEQFESDKQLIAYAISGRDGRNGYIQRLAGRPEHQHQGHGLSLVTDSLRWMARWRVQRALVNTHIGNDAALALYHRLGFTDLSDHLHVYERRIE